MVQAPVPRGPRGPYRKSAERRRRIVAAAAQVFSRDGYRGATIRAIAAEAGMSPSSLLHFFGSKQELLWATMAHRDAHKFAGGREGVRGYPDRVVGQAVANEEIPHLIQLYAVLSAESATRDHPAQEYFATRFAKVRDGITAEFTALADAGLLRPGVDPRTAAVTVVALWDGVQLQWLHDPEVISAAQVLRDYFALVLAEPSVLTDIPTLRRQWRACSPRSAPDPGDYDGGVDPVTDAL
ncbi:TetR/AcrR family transcriptional regulator [Ruania albidiflava]|uniref:TetR/AcrR family transcriptional regulator n=1 Tax=Ruania albidiflava TaxID=366586 RepID=UPI0003B36C7C|nr:TetR/AcrR family transcriptional regulator [Ruania albidiflava]